MTAPKDWPHCAECAATELVGATGLCVVHHAEVAMFLQSATDRFARNVARREAWTKQWGYE